MIQKFIIFILIFFVFKSSVVSQTALNSEISIDTLRSDYSISGELYKSDLSSSINLSSVGWSSYHPWLFDPIDFIYTGNPFQTEKKIQSIRYTSLPHIGFLYSFGSSGFQNAVVNYTQSFINNLLINFDYNTSQSNGILRNSGFKNQDIHLNFLKQWKKVNLHLDVNSLQRTYEWNGGIINDSLPLSFSLGLIPVNKVDAISVRKDVSVISNTSFKLTGDSLKYVGISIRNIFDSQNRVYTETGDLASIYSTILVDSFQTRDQLQISTQKNNISFFMKSKKLDFDIGVEQIFWNYRNVNLYRDTLEVLLNEKIQFISRDFKIKQNFQYYFVGRSSNWVSEISVNKKSALWGVDSYWKIENSLPELFQRHYFSNNIFYQLPVYENQFKSRLDLNLYYHLKNSKIDFTSSYIYLKRPYFFNGQTWENSLYSQVNAIKLSISINSKYKFLRLSPNYSICALPSQMNFYPVHNLSLRASVENGIFKNRKLKAYFGLEPRLIGGYSPIALATSMDLFLTNYSNTEQSAYFDMSIFSGIELKGFKFFARADNLGYFWNNRMLQVIKGYPIPLMQIKIGITWDFWN